MKYKYLFAFSLISTLNLFGQGLNHLNTNLPCVEKNFNLLIHLTVDSTTRQPYLTSEDVDDLLIKTTAFFEPICMSFSSCEINEISNYTFHKLVDDSLRISELEVLYAKPGRLNIFILGDIPNQSCGLSSFYGIDQADNKGGYIFLETEGCDEKLEGQLAHHLGHYFGLSDTYRGDDLEYVTEPNCSVKADSLCDTPTDPFGKYIDSLGVFEDISSDLIKMDDFINLNSCEFILDLPDPNGEYYQPKVGNIMSAYPCKCGFTNDQLNKIVVNYNRSNYKPY